MIPPSGVMLSANDLSKGIVMIRSTTIDSTTTVPTPSAGTTTSVELAARPTADLAHLPTQKRCPNTLIEDLVDIALMGFPEKTPEALQRLSDDRLSQLTLAARSMAAATESEILRRSGLRFSAMTSV